MACRARDARAQDEHARRGDGAGRRHEHRKEPRERGRRHEHGLVAGRGRLRREHVHHLRDRRARDHVDRDRRDLARGEGAHEVVLDEREEERDERAPLLEAAHLVDARRADLHDGVGVGQERLERRVDARPGSAVLVVAGERRGAGAGLDRGVDLLRREPLDRLRHDGDAPLAGDALLADRDSHVGGRIQDACPPAGQGDSAPGMTSPAKNCSSNRVSFAGSVQCIMCPASGISARWSVANDAYARLLVGGVPAERAARDEEDWAGDPAGEGRPARREERHGERVACRGSAFQATPPSGSSRERASRRCRSTSSATRGWLPTRRRSASSRVAMRRGGRARKARTSSIHRRMRSGATSCPLSGGPAPSSSARRVTRLRERAREQVRDRAPHRVPDEEERRARRYELLDEVGEIEDVVREVVVAARGYTRAVAVASQVGRQDAKSLPRSALGRRAPRWRQRPCSRGPGGPCASPWPPASPSALQGHSRT